MAKLDEIAKMLNVEIPPREKENITSENVVGIKRRAWLGYSSDSTDSDINKSEANREQTTSKQEANWRQIESKLEANKESYKSKLGAKPEALLEANRKQIGNKLEATTCFSSLVGQERLIVIFLYNECKNARDKITPPIVLEHIASFIKTTEKTVKTAMKRLEKKGCILRKNFKAGRGGWTRYEIPDSIFHMLLHNETGSKLEANWKQTESKLGAKQEAKSEAGASSSSSFNIITTTDTESEDDDFDIQPLAKIAFTQQHLKQITDQKKLDPESIQQSIYQFAYDYQNGHVKINTSPLKFFMGILKKGNIYISEHYVDPQEEKRKLFLEKCRQEKEEKKEIEKAIMCKNCTEWLNSLTSDEKKDIAIHETPTHLKNHWANHMYDTLENHFKEKIWPEKRQEAYDKAEIPFIPLREIS